MKKGEQISLYPFFTGQRQNKGGLLGVQVPMKNNNQLFPQGFGGFKLPGSEEPGINLELSADTKVARLPTYDRVQTAPPTRPPPQKKQKPREVRDAMPFDTATHHSSNGRANSGGSTWVPIKARFPWLPSCGLPGSSGIGFNRFL